jgi:UDP-N-acetylmuramoyl-tripeptide--D-alanyl-D-alanine ligase
LLAVREVGGDVARAAEALAAVGAAPGRGERIRVPIAGGELLLVDESYNANPASMAAAIRTAAAARSGAFPRLVLALGDMLELGEASVALHRGLQKDVDAVHADLVFASGPHMRALWEALDPARQGAWGATSKDIEQPLLGALRPGDVVMVKGSNGSRMAPLVAAIKALAVTRAA